MATLTVFTPTYNRAHTLHRVYDSLCSQTGVDFEWLVVDDGSTDATADLVERWRSLANFPIRYIRQPNRGKHVAINRAVGLTESPYLVILDSDDACVPGALAALMAIWNGISDDRREQFGLVTVLCQTEQGSTVGSRFPDDVFDSTYYEMVVLFGMRGDKWECYRTQVLREFPFPEDLRESALPEGIILGRIGTRYRTRFVNQTLRIYHDDGADSSIVRSTNPRRNPQGRKWQQRENLTVPRFLFEANPWAFVIFALKYSRMCGLAQTSLRSALGELPWRLSRILVILLWPCGRFLAAFEVLGRQTVSGVLRKHL